MVVSGLPERQDDHASQIAQMSLALLNKVKTFTIKHRPIEQLKLRIGMHSGALGGGGEGHLHSNARFIVFAFRLGCGRCRRLENASILSFWASFLIN